MSSLLVTCQLVAAALIEDIALNAKGRQKLGGANCSSKRSLGTMCRRGRTDIGLTPTVLLFSTPRSSMHVPHAVLEEEM